MLVQTPPAQPSDIKWRVTMVSPPCQVLPRSYYANVGSGPMFCSNLRLIESKQARSSQFLTSTLSRWWWHLCPVLTVSPCQPPPPRVTHISNHRKYFNCRSVSATEVNICFEMIIQFASFQRWGCCGDFLSSSSYVVFVIFCHVLSSRISYNTNNSL